MAKSMAEEWRSYSKNKKIIVGVLAGFAVLLFLSILTPQDEFSNYTPTPDANVANLEVENNDDIEPETVAKLGTPARDGKFEFTVKTVKCDVSYVGDEYFREEPQGQFCVVTLRIKNIGEEAQTFWADDQKLLDAEKLQYSYDSLATTYYDSDNDISFEEINPGNSIEGSIVYDIPEGITPVSIELHDSSLSGGVVVQLKK